MRPIALTAVAATAALSLTACGSATHAVASKAPALYTNANAAGVWQHPERHLGAHVDERGTVQAVTRARQGVLVALAVPGTQRVVAAHVFDRRFRPRPGGRLHVIGSVRGPLGRPDVPGVRVVAPLAPGAAVLDARAASTR